MLLVIGKAPSLRTQHTPLERQAPLRTRRDPSDQEDGEEEESHEEEAEPLVIGVMFHAPIITDPARDARENQRKISR